MTSALDMCRLAEDAWKRSQPQMFLELEDSAPAAVDGSPTKPSRLVLSPGRLGATPVSPGPSTHPASTDGGSPCSVTLPPGEERGAGLTFYGDGRATLGEEAAVAGGDST